MRTSKIILDFCQSDGRKVRCEEMTHYSWKTGIPTDRKVNMFSQFVFHRDSHSKQKPLFFTSLLYFAWCQEVCGSSFFHTFPTMIRYLEEISRDFLLFRIKISFSLISQSRREEVYFPFSILIVIF